MESGDQDKDSLTETTPRSSDDAEDAVLQSLDDEKDADHGLGLSVSVTELSADFTRLSAADRGTGVVAGVGGAIRGIEGVGRNANVASIGVGDNAIVGGLHGGMSFVDAMFGSSTLGGFGTPIMAMSACPESQQYETTVRFIII